MKPLYASKKLSISNIRAIEIAENSIEFSGRYYEIAFHIANPSKFPNNYEIAVRD